MPAQLDASPTSALVDVPGAAPGSLPNPKLGPEAWAGEQQFTVAERRRPWIIDQHVHERILDSI
jgi:hypothetical protein